MPRPQASTVAADPWLTRTTTFLLPLYFLLAGTSVDLSDFDASSWSVLAWVLIVAILGKLAGSWLGATLTGTEPTDALRVAILLNTRGLTEIVILQMGLQLGVLDVEMFSIMVIMALATTAMTGPALTLLERRASRKDRAPADREHAPSDPSLT